MACEKFWQKPENVFCGIISKFDFMNTVLWIFTIFAACFMYEIPKTHTKIEVSKSKTVVTRECLSKGSKYVKIWKVNFI